MIKVPIKTVKENRQRERNLRPSSSVERKAKDSTTRVAEYKKNMAKYESYLERYQGRLINRDLPFV